MGSYRNAQLNRQKQFIKCADWSLPYGVSLPRPAQDSSSMEAQRAARRAAFLDAFRKQNPVVPAPLTAAQQQRRNEFNRRYERTYGEKRPISDPVLGTLSQVPSVLANPRTYIDWNNDIGTWTNNAISKIPSAGPRILGGLTDLGRHAANGVYNTGTALASAVSGKPWTFTDVMAMDRSNPYTAAARGIDAKVGTPIASIINYINPFKRSAQVGNAIMTGNPGASAPTGPRTYSEYVRRAPGGTWAMGALEDAAADTAFMGGVQAGVEKAMDKLQEAGVRQLEINDRASELTDKMNRHQLKTKPYGTTTQAELNRSAPADSLVVWDDEYPFPEPQMAMSNNPRPGTLSKMVINDPSADVYLGTPMQHPAVTRHMWDNKPVTMTDALRHELGHLKAHTTGVGIPPSKVVPKPNVFTDLFRDIPFPRKNPIVVNEQIADTLAFGPNQALQAFHHPGIHTYTSAVRLGALGRTFNSMEKLNNIIRGNGGMGAALAPSRK